MDPAIKLLTLSMFIALFGYGLIRGHRMFEMYKHQVPVGRTQPWPFIGFMKWLALGLGIIFFATALLLFVTAIWALWNGDG